MIPLTQKTLEKILNPQPEAQKVIHRLLDFINRVDLASQHGLPKPAFKTSDGQDIFTDVQRKVPRGGECDSQEHEAELHDSDPSEDDAGLDGGVGY